MSLAFKAIEAFLGPYRAHARPLGTDDLELLLPTDWYRNSEEELCLRVVGTFCVAQQLLSFRAPCAYRVSGPHVDAFLRAAILVQSDCALVRFLFDEDRGEVSLSVETPLLDRQQLTSHLVEGSITRLLLCLESYHDSLCTARDTGAVDVEAGEELGAADELRVTQDKDSQRTSNVHHRR